MKMSAQQATDFSPLRAMHAPASQPICLLVEECDFERKRMRRVFSSAKLELDLIEASSISQARKKMATHKIDLILLDNHLNDGLGLFFARELQQLGKQGNPPIVMVTGEDAESLREAAQEAGCVGFIKKEELDAERLSAAVEIAFKSSRPPELALNTEDAKQLRRMLHDQMRDLIIEVNTSVLRISRLSRKLQRDVEQPELSERKLHAAEIEALSDDLHRRLNTVIAEGITEKR